MFVRVVRRRNMVLVHLRRVAVLGLWYEGKVSGRDGVAGR